MSLERLPVSDSAVCPEPSHDGALRPGTDIDSGDSYESDSYGFEVGVTFSFPVTWSFLTDYATALRRANAAGNPNGVADRRVVSRRAQAAVSEEPAGAVEIPARRIMKETGAAAGGHRDPAIADFPPVHRAEERLSNTASPSVAFSKRDTWEMVIPKMDRPPRRTPAPTSPTSFPTSQPVTRRAQDRAVERRGNPRMERALALCEKGRVEEALALLCEPGDYDQDLFLLRGDLQRDLGRWHEAVGSYSTIIALDRENTYAYENLAESLCKLQRWDPAADVFRKLLDFDKYCDAARIGLGQCLLHLNRPEAALACFEACWSERAAPAARFGTAVALQKMQRFQEAQAQYLKMLETNAAAEALSNLIAMSMEVFDLPKVERYALQRMERDADSAMALKALIVVALERREYERASKFYSRLRQTAPEAAADSGNGSQNDVQNEVQNDADAVAYRLSRSKLEQLERLQPETAPERRRERAHFI